jgi:murein L,D-transpeptidase YafK
MKPSSVVRAVVAIASFAGVSGCGFGGVIQPRPFALSRAHLDVSSDPAGARRDFLPWAAAEAYLVVVDKETRELAVYRFGERHRDYPVVFGRSRGRKQFEGDRRTPSGTYRITRKRKHSRYHRFLDLDYPNPEDLARYREALDKGLVPKGARGSGRAGPGRLLGIHGTDKEDLNRLGVDWTFGCVSMNNHDVGELFDLVPEGTLVLIADGDVPW